MKKLLISVAAVVTAGALILTGCPDGSTGSGSGGGGNFVTPKCEVATGATSTIDLVYGDGNYTAGCTQLEPATVDPFGQFGAGTTFTETSGGASNTSKAYRLALTDAAAAFGGGFISLAADYDATGKTLKFSVKSNATTDGGYNMIRVYLEADSGANAAFPDYQTCKPKVHRHLSTTVPGKMYRLTLLPYFPVVLPRRRVRRGI